MSEKDNGFDLDKPSVPDAEQDEVQEESAAASEAEESEEETSEETHEESSDDTDVEEQDPPRIPYSRFEDVNERRIRAEQELETLRQQMEQSKLSKASTVDETGLPDYWKRLYGDSEASKEAFALRQQELQTERQTLAQQLREDMQREMIEQEQRVEETVEIWDSQISDFAAKSKRRFTDEQKSGILDVMDELAPKDEKGSYIVEPIQYLNQAVELYDLRQEKASQPKKEAKRRTAMLTSAKSQGDTGASKPPWNGDWWSKLSA